MSIEDAKDNTWYVCLKSYRDFKKGGIYLSHFKGIGSTNYYGGTAWFSESNTYKYFRLAKENEIPRILKGSFWKALKDIYYGLGKNFIKNHIYESPADGYLYPSGSNVPCKIHDNTIAHLCFRIATKEEINYFYNIYLR